VWVCVYIYIRPKSVGELLLFVGGRRRTILNYPVFNAAFQRILFTVRQV